MPALLLFLLVLLPAQSKTDPTKALAKTLEGTVFLADAKSAAGAIVIACKLDHDPQDQRKEVKADLQGRYHLPLSPGTWTLFAWKGSHAGEGICQRVTTRIKVGEGLLLEPIDIYLEERGAVHVRVLAEETNEPISGARVILENGIHLTTDAKGETQPGGGLATGCHWLGVMAPGRAMTRVYFSQVGNQTTFLEVKLPAGGVIRGRVTDLEGKPVAGALVGPYHRWPYRCGVSQEASTNLQGEYTMAAFAPAGHRETIYASAKEFTYGTSRNFLTGKADESIDLVLGLRRVYPRVKPEALLLRTIAGIVVDPKDKPVKGALITWEESVSFTQSSIRQTRTNDLGEFQIIAPQVEGGLSVSAKGFIPYWSSIKAIGDQKVSCDLGRGKVLQGTLVDDQGSPIAGAWIAPYVRSDLSAKPWKEQAVRTDAEGRFVLSGVKKGLHFQVIHTGLGQLEGELFENEVPIDRITFPRSEIIRGRVVDPHGRPVQNFVIDWDEIRNDRNEPFNRNGAYFYDCKGSPNFSSVGGEFILTGLAPGKKYALAAKVPGFGDGTGEGVARTAVAQGVPSDSALLQLTAPHAWKIKVVQRDGQLIKGAKLSLIPGNSSKAESFNWSGVLERTGRVLECVTNEDGLAHFSRLEQAQGTLLVQASGFARQRIHWKSSLKESTIVMLPEAILEGEIVTEHTWALISGQCCLQIRLPNNELFEFTPKHQRHGKFRIEGLPAGVKASCEVTIGLFKVNPEDTFWVDLKEGINPFLTIKR